LSPHVLAIQLKRIGDLLLTTPALHALRTAGARVTLALADNTAPLLPALTGEVIDDTLVFRRGSIQLAQWRRVAFARRGEFDAVVDFTGNDRSALLTRLSGARQRVIARDALKRAARWRPWCYTAFAETDVRLRHTVDRYLDTVRALALLIPEFSEKNPPAPVLHLPAEARAAAQEAMGGHTDYAVVHPGSARAEKYWPPERWAVVIDHVQRVRGVPVALTGGRGDPFEDAHLQAIRAALSAPVAADLAGRLDLLALAALIAGSAFFLGVDSGPMHLLAAARRPAVVLFGPTNPFHWRPRHAECRVLRAGEKNPPARGNDDPAFPPAARGGSMNEISVDAVLAALP